MAQFTAKSVEVIGDTACFSGMRLCVECGNAQWMIPDRFPYAANPKPECLSCSKGELIPLLDSEVAYYVTQRWKLSHELQRFRNLLNGFVA